MSDAKCPKCGADYESTAYVFGNNKGCLWQCGTRDRRTEDGVLDGLYLGVQCLRNQLAAAQAENERLQGELSHYISNEYRTACKNLSDLLPTPTLEDVGKFVIESAAEHIERLMQRVAELEGERDQLNDEIGSIDLLVQDCAMLIRRLCYRIHKANTSDSVKLQAEEFLKRKGLQGSPLRGDVEILDTTDQESDNA